MTIEIKPIEHYQIPEAKRVILSVAYNIYQWPAPLDEIIQQFYERGELRDVDDFQSEYLDRQGLFLVVLDQNRLIGTGALRRLDGDIAELKRLWLLEAYHGQGIGYRLVQNLFSFARDAGFRRIRLLTDIRSVRARHFYQQVGFHYIECAGDDPEDVCLELALQ
jgi:putative acetyltransferase